MASMHMFHHTPCFLSCFSASKLPVVPKSRNKYHLCLHGLFFSTKYFDNSHKNLLKLKLLKDALWFPHYWLHLSERLANCTGTAENRKRRDQVKKPQFTAWHCNPRNEITVVWQTEMMITYIKQGDDSQYDY